MLKKHIKGLLNKGLNKKELESESIAHNIDYKLYEVANPDVYKAVRRRKFPNSASHFDKFGMQEVRTGKRLLYKGFPPFDETTYIKHNTDVAEAVENGNILISFLCCLCRLTQIKSSVVLLLFLFLFLHMMQCEPVVYNYYH